MLYCLFSLHMHCCAGSRTECQGMCICACERGGGRGEGKEIEKGTVTSIIIGEFYLKSKLVFIL